jgi:hypothetical protein
VEAQFSTIIYEAFQNAVKNPNPLQVITISFSFFQIHCMLQFTNLVQVITECRNCSANAVLKACARQSAPTVRALPSAHALQVHAQILSAPRDSTGSRPVCGSRPKLSVPVPVPACARSCSGWRPARFRGHPPQTANCHVGGQQ